MTGFWIRLCWFLVHWVLQIYFNHSKNIKTRFKEWFEAKKIRMKPRIFRVYSRPLLGATSAPNLLPWVFKKVFSLEMVKNGICLGGASKQNAFFSKMVSQKRYTCPQCLKQVLILVKISFAELSFQKHLNIPSLLRSYILTLPWLFILAYLLANPETHAFL